MDHFPSENTTFHKWHVNIFTDKKHFKCLQSLNGYCYWCPSCTCILRRFRHVRLYDCSSVHGMNCPFNRFILTWRFSLLALRPSNSDLNVNVSCATRMIAIYLHVCLITLLTHSWHLTSQHQWNLQLHWTTSVRLCVSWPRPQHMTSQWSSSVEPVVLQMRSRVPGIRSFGSRLQNALESFRYTRLCVCGFFELFDCKTRCSGFAPPEVAPVKASTLKAVW